jgi:hypothetical protein
MVTKDDQRLANSYREKVRQGKQPTKAESRAHQQVIESATLEQLRNCSPKFFCTLFGVQNKQRYDWEDRYQFPCGRGRDTIDLFAVSNKIKELIASNRKYLGTGSAQRYHIG